MTLLDYHRLKRLETDAWDPVRMEAGVRAQDPGFPERVASLMPSGEYKSPLTADSPSFRQMRGLCELWLTATVEQSAFIRSKIQWKQAFQLGGFRVQAKRLALENNSESWLRLALASLAIDDFNCGDARDAIMSVRGLLVAARKIHADWGALVRAVSALSGPGMAALLKDHLNNHPA